MRIPLSAPIILFSSGLFAQSGTIDTGFDPIDLSGGTANGLNGSCWAITVQCDGKVLVAGDFTIVNGVERSRIARLNTDGSLDLDFDPGFGANATVRAVAVQPDGKMLVGGMFTYFDAHACNHIVRLNADGSVDEGFDPGNGFDGNVFSLLAQPDGDFLVGGDFFHMNGVISRGLARLNPDGSRDAAFSAGDISGVYSMAQLPDGRVVLGGLYSFLSGVDRRCIGAIEPDGTVDLSFAPFGWGSSPVFALALQPDGKVLAGGMIPGGIARMEANGEMDPFFGSGVSGFGGWDPWVYAMALQSDGKILCAGRFVSYNGAPCNGIARLNADGTLDTEFHVGTGFNADVFAMTMQPDGKVLVGGFFSDVDGTPRNRIARLFAEEFSTDIQEATDASVEVFPNPSEGRVFIRTNMDGAPNISVIGPEGRTVQAPIVPFTSAGLGSVDLGAYAKGVYFVRVAKGMAAHTERVVIQ